MPFTIRRDQVGGSPILAASRPHDARKVSRPLGSAFVLRPHPHPHLGTRPHEPSRERRAPSLTSLKVLRRENMA